MPTITYPFELVGEVATSLGPVVVRPIRPDDAAALTAAHDRLSPETQYLRFFSAHPRMRPAEAERFTNVDYHDRLALVAELDSHLIAVARYDRLDGGDEAEVAFTVGDPYQGHGLGGLLLRRLMDAAPERGIHRFTAFTLPENRRMLAVFRKAAPDCTVRFTDGMIKVEFPVR